MEDVCKRDVQPPPCSTKVVESDDVGIPGQTQATQPAVGGHGESSVPITRQGVSEEPPHVYRTKLARFLTQGPVDDRPVQ